MPSLVPHATVRKDRGYLRIVRNHALGFSSFLHVSLKHDYYSLERVCGSIDLTGNSMSPMWHSIFSKALHNFRMNDLLTAERFCCNIVKVISSNPTDSCNPLRCTPLWCNVQFIRHVYWKLHFLDRPLNYTTALITTVLLELFCNRNPYTFVITIVKKSWKRHEIIACGFLLSLLFSIHF